MATSQNGAVKGPTPILILLTAVRRAVDAGVDRDKISTMLDMSIAAASTQEEGKPKSQSPIFKNCARTLDGYSDAATPAEIQQ